MMEQSSDHLHTLIKDVSGKIMQRFDALEQILKTLTPKSLKEIKLINGERVYDNQDLCEMLNKSKRTLQRYRSSGDLPYTIEKGTTYYTESDIRQFQENMAKEFEAKRQQREAQKSQEARTNATTLTPLTATESKSHTTNEMVL